MNKEWLEKYQVFVYLIIIILGMIGLKLKYGYRQNTQISDLRSQISETPTKIPTPTTIEINNKDYPLQKQLPYQGKGFVIEKYTAPMTLSLKLNTATQQQAAKDIGVWLETFGEMGSGHIIELEEATPTTTKK